MKPVHLKTMMLIVLSLSLLAIANAQTSTGLSIEACSSIHIYNGSLPMQGMTSMHVIFSDRGETPSPLFLGIEGAVSYPRINHLTGWEAGATFGGVIDIKTVRLEPYSVIGYTQNSRMKGTFTAVGLRLVLFDQKRVSVFLDLRDKVNSRVLFEPRSFPRKTN